MEGVAINRVNRSDEEKRMVKNLILEGMSIKEIMDKHYEGYKTGCSDYSFIVSMRRELKKEGHLGVEAKKLTSSKSPKVDLRSFAVESKKTSIPDSDKSALIEELLAQADRDIKKCEKRLDSLRRTRELILALR